MEQKQLDEINDQYFGEEFIEEEIIDELKPKEPERERKESPKKLKVTKVTPKKPEMEVYYEEPKFPEIKITPAKERPPLETHAHYPLHSAGTKPIAKETPKEIPKEMDKSKEAETREKQSFSGHQKSERFLSEKEEPVVRIEETAASSNPIEKKASGWKWFFRLVILVILVILVVRAAKYWGDDNVPLDLSDTLPDTNLNTTPIIQSNTSLNTAAVSSDANQTAQNETKTSLNQTKAPAEFTLTAKRWLFEPNKIKANKGDKIKITLLNPEQLKFRFEIKELGVAKDISAETTIFEFAANNNGTFKYRCSSCEAWRGMEGTLVVS